MKFFAKNDKGFTFIEILSVLVILGIIAAVAASRVMTMDKDVTAEIDRLRGNLRFAQYLAMSNNTVGYDVSITAGSYTLRMDTTPATVNFPDSGSPTHTFQGGIAVTSGDVDVPFDEWGSPGANNIVITLTGGDTITITRNTGFIP